MKRITQKEEGFLMTVKERNIFISTCLGSIRSEIRNLKRLDALSYRDARELEAHVDKIFYPVRGTESERR